MTNAQLVKEYDRFLSEVCGCYEDAVGNRPCDNGAVCDMCMAESVQAMWEEIKRKKAVKWMP